MSNYLPVDLPAVLWVLLGLNTVFLFLLLVGQVRAGLRLKRIERAIGGASTAEGMREEATAVAESLESRKSENREQKQLFKDYLEEDSSRKLLPKREQFEGFRKWRSEKGLNWR